ncbi:MAG: hypothetical protein JWR61_1329 [Ferruginibacter sp.]|uniref:ELWxxDGT repeat protein n=1 Tax=Ferruginibacter sp. TaxID=1940288 RepID=UPI002659F236|nr:ELWxxDGT repeat protein [Ferruginibacter sp.]MDB5276374.1 hypothetical protein [Ferruginibacter sp.]
MKRTYLLPYVLMFLACIGIGTSLTAQKISLTDINKIKSSYPSNYQADNGVLFAVLNGVFYFTADDGIHGRELFASDGTANGTHLVKDINPGSASSVFAYTMTSGGKLYFISYNQNYAQTIWVSDGTDAGTVPIANLPAAYYGFFSYLTDVSGTLFFTYTYYNSNGNFAELYKTDATGKNAVLVTSVNGYIQEMVGSNGRLFYSFYDYGTNSGSELYTSDGTAAGTGLVADINTNPYTGSTPVHLTPVNGLLYFAADDGTGNQLWASDGTTNGTYKVKNSDHILLATDASNGGNLFATANNTIYFQGKIFDGANSSTGFELCKFNTADPTGNVTLVKDIVPGNAGSLPGAFTSVNGNVFFTATANGRLSQLWKTDGTSGGTVLVKDFLTDIDSTWSNPFYGFTSINGKLLFACTSATLGTELWNSDGTAAGTFLLKDILPGKEGSGPNDITPDKNIALFSALSAAGNELWRTDGTAAGTMMVKDINTITTGDGQPSAFTTLNDKVIFGAYNGIGYQKAYISDGSKNGTTILDSATNVVSLGFSQKTFVIFKKEAYFFNESRRLCKTNGTKTGTIVLPTPSLIESNAGFISDLVAADNLLYATTYSFQTNTTTLWRTDGTKAGTYILKTDINSDFNVFPVTVGSTLYFANVDSKLGSQLWKSDGTVTGTRVVKTIGSYNFNPLSNLYNFKGKLYFNAYTANSGVGAAIWQSDGTEAGTIVLKDLSVYQQPFGEANGKLFFYAHDNVSSLGDELYATDGTAAGTKMVKDINPGASSSIAYLGPSALISGKKILYFLATTDEFGQEWWQSDGTSAGTRLIKDLVEGPGWYYFTSAISVNDHLYAVTYDNTLLESSGTDVTPVNDAILPGLKNITNLFGAGSKLYFSAYTYAVGQELYIGNMGTPTTQRLAAIAAPVNTQATRLSLQVSPDPAYNTVQVACTGLKQNTPATLLLISPSGAVLKSQQYNSIAGTISLDVASLASGIYFIKVISGDNTLLSRFIKQ